MRCFVGAVGICQKNCPQETISMREKKAVIGEACVNCGICLRVCPFKAVQAGLVPADAVKCQCCPVECDIQPGFEGACKRYTNIAGRLVRNRDLVTEALDRKTRRKITAKTFDYGSRCWNNVSLLSPGTTYC